MPSVRASNSCMFPYLEKNLALSIISAMELLSFSGMTETESQSTRAFINDCTEITLSNDIKEKTIEIRKKYRTKLPDAIIAAAAIVNGLPLITADKGFKQIEELDLQLIVPIM